MNKESKSGIFIFIALVVVVLVVSVKDIVLNKSGTSISIQKGNGSTIELNNNYDKDTVKRVKGEYVAALYITGTIEELNQEYDQQWLLNTISQLKADSANQGIVIFMDSPGGAVYQADEVYLALQDYKTSGKKVAVYMGSLAASGGYYISCAANEIWANRNTLTGSIGVISGQSVDMSELLNKVGIKVTTVHSGKNKLMGHMSEPFTEEQKEIMQSISDECYQQFTDIVAKGRNLPLDEVYELADGRVYTAKQALEAKLIDRIDNWENCLKYFTEDLIQKPGIKIETFKKEKKQTLRELMTGAVSDLFYTQSAATLGVPVKLLKELDEFDSYPAYLYTK